MQTLKLSKVRARKLAEPKVKLKYPKKLSIKTEDSSITVVKNDIPWTLHPLPPPLSTARPTIRLEADKSMPWALHPLPPPVKTKNYSDYYWPDPKSRPPKYFYGTKPYKFTNAYKHHKPAVTDFKPSNFKYSGFKPSDYRPSNFNPPGFVDPSEYRPAVDYKPDVFKQADHKPPENNVNSLHNNNNKNYNKHVNDYKHVDYKHVDYKQHVDYKSPDYKQNVDYKSPDYKSDFPKFPEEQGGDDVGDAGDHHAYDHSSYAHDDHSADADDFPSPSALSGPQSEYVSHISIEPSIQISSFSETELQGDGSTRQTVSHDNSSSEQTRCRCATNGQHLVVERPVEERPINVHRHKRSANGTERNATIGTVTVQQPPMSPKLNDSVAERSARSSWFSRPHVGHATDVEIQKSHDITDLSPMVVGNRVQPARGDSPTKALRPPDRVVGGQPKKIDLFKDDSDMFKVDFGREINAWDESKAAAAAKGPSPPRYTSLRNFGFGDSAGNGDGGSDSKPRDGWFVSAGSGGGGGDGGGSDGGGGGGGGSDFGSRQTRKPDQGRGGYRVTTSKKENKEGGVSFSVQTPFSVSSFSSNVRHPFAEHDDGYSRSRSRFGESRTTPSPLSYQSPSSSLSSDHEAPLDFEQFGFKSADHFSRPGFDNDKPSAMDGGDKHVFSEGFGGDRTSEFPGRLSEHFSRDFGDDNRGNGRFKPRFRYITKDRGSVADRFNDGQRFKDGRGGGGGGGAGSKETVLEYFQPVVVDFADKSKDDKLRFKLPFGNDDEGSRGYFSKTDSTGFGKFKKDRNPDPLRLPGGLHESTENLSRKMLFHPSTFDID